MSAARPLRCTYRLQLSGAFDFEAARRIVAYLADLGVSHLYLSPIWAARPGSSHGYDVVDHTRISPELGGEAGFDALAAAAQAHGLGLVLDCVPNHMGIGYDNPWWCDVLTWGEASPYSEYFDIDWQPAEPTLAGKVLLPILGDHYGRVLEEGHLTPDFEGGRLVVRYWEHTVPLHPRETADVLDAAVTAAKKREDTTAAETLVELAGQSRQVAKRRERVSRQRRRADRDRAAQLVDRLAHARREPALEAALQSALAQFTPKSAGDADGRAADRLHRLLERQAYRLAFWRLASQEINYRRFFDINDLAGLRMEDPALFEAAHRKVVALLGAARADGVRLDHVDGLLDPVDYLQRLDRALKRAGAEAPSVHVEKILGHDEALRADWPVDGTTGYEVMNLLHGLQVAPDARRPLMALYRDLVAPAAGFVEETVASKRLIMATSLAAELNVLAGDLNRIAKRSRLTRDYARQSLRDALAGVVAHFPVYRTYVTPKGAAEADRAIIKRAVARARHAATTPDLSVYDFVEAVLTTDAASAPWPGARRAEIVRFARRFQQYTGPVTAKAVEDTTFYRWFPLVSLNEVGGEPDRFATAPATFHAANAERLARWPRALVATATHDHKRGEDVRARLAVLSERPQEWSRAVRRWFRLAEPLVVAAEDGPAPSAADRWLFFQTVVGAWPLDLATDDEAGLAAYATRLQGYMQKAIREAKRHTSWAVNDVVYEAAVHDFVEAALDPQQSPRLAEEFHAFVDEIAAAGAVNGLAQTTLKLTIPGVPDIYQGTEGWDLSLVDPDNRRPVDYAAWASSLAALRGGAAVAELAASWRDGRIKQAVLARLLAARRDDPELFAAGAYEPLAVEGEAADEVVAFARRLDDRALVVAVPRLAANRLAAAATLRLGWGDTRIATALDGDRAGDLLRDAPVALDGGVVKLAEVAASPPLAVIGWRRD
ncbi:MAG: malto-oligosyltrehalose synthase [Alphaproteobacteria bacterium]